MNGARLLALWEHAATLPPMARAALLAASTGGDGSAHSWSVGERDAQLLRARRQLVGDDLHCVTGCPQCRAELELTMSTAAILAAEPDAAIPPGKVRVGDIEVTVHPVRSRDLEELERLGLTDTAFQAALLERCVELDGSGTIDVGELTFEAVDLIAAELQRVDPLSVVWVELQCADCGVSWKTQLDIAALFWSDLSRASHELIRDVWSLARSYGWSEAEILAMSPIRRRTYLELAHA